MVMVATSRSHSHLASFEGAASGTGAALGPSFFPGVPMLSQGLPRGD